MDKNSLTNVLNLFWEWITLTPQLYATISRERDLEEYMFPLWDILIIEAIRLVKKAPTDKTSIDSILTAMAIDNENEDILDYISQNSDKLFIAELIEVGSTHCQPNARWQCAEIIRRCKPQNGDKILHKLLSDSDDYVAKRAQIAIDSCNTGDGFVCSVEK